MAVKAAGYVIFRRLNGIKQYLLLQASYEPHHWTPPKGHVDPGEDEPTAALRELGEEAGLYESDISVIPSFKKTVEYEVNNRLKTVTYWLAELKDPQKVITLSKEHQNYNWFPIQEAMEISGFKTSRELLSESDKYLTKNGY